MDPDQIFDNPLSDDNLPDFVQESPPEPQAEPTPEPAPEVTEVAPVPLAEPAAPEITAEEPPQEPTAEQVKAWAGKYTSPEELEKGYRELRDLQRRTAERAKAHEQRSLEIESRARQLEDALRRAIPYVQQVTQRAQQQQVQRDPYSMDEPAPAPTVDPRYMAQMVQQQVDAQVQQRLNQYQAVQAQQAMQAAEYTEAASNFQRFFETHPEVEPNGPVDEDIAATILALNEAWAPTGSEVDIASQSALEIAYEASQRPALRTVLELNPAYIDTDAGMTLARKLASELDGITQPTPEGGRAPVAAPRSNTPVVERGSSQAPVETPLDEYDQAVADYKKSLASRGSEVFFGS